VTAVAIPGDPGRLAVFLANPDGEVFTTSGSSDHGWDNWSTVAQGHTGPGAPVTAVSVPGDPSRMVVVLANPDGEVFTTSAAMDTIHALISLERLHCHKHGDVASGEPYLWTAFFKIDGDTFTLDLNDDGILFLNGHCTFVPTPGSHGNLGVTDVDEGDDVPIPAAVGKAEFSVTPILPSAGVASGPSLK
jgi:hypothetical protein